MNIKTTGIVGSGIIGTSFTALFARFGFEVRLYDMVEAALKKAEVTVGTYFDLFVEKGVMTNEEVVAAKKRIKYVKTLEECVVGVDLIQECVPEVQDIKRSTFARIDALNPTAIYCSSVATMTPSVIQDAGKHPERFIAGHPFNPPHLMPIIELCGGKLTDPKYVEEAKEFYLACKREPIIVRKEIFGYIGNRLQGALLREAVDLVCRGVCSVEDVDKATLYSVGLRWAIQGQMLTLETNASGGIRDYLKRYAHLTWELMWPDMAKWDVWPQEFIDVIGPEGVAEAMRNRPAETGNTRNEIIAWRDNLYAEIDKLTGHL